MARGRVFKKPSGWYAYRVDIGTDPATGRRKQLQKSGFRTKGAATTALNEVIQSIADGSAVNRSSVTIADYFAEWMIGQRQRLPLSPKSVRNTHVVLRKALADAERLGLVIRNAAASAKPPVVRRKEFRTWTADEVRRFFAEVADDRLLAAFVLFATTGMRRGEVLGLRWSDVDLGNAQLAVVHTLTTVDYQPVISTPKTKRSRRVVYLDATTIIHLGAHRQRQEIERQAAGPDWCDDLDLVFRDEFGRPLNPDWFSADFGRRLRSSELPKIRLHDLRHTHATLALKAGVHPKIVSERLGHSSIAVTLDLYSHVTPAIARGAADSVANQIFVDDGDQDDRQ